MNKSKKKITPLTHGGARPNAGRPRSDTDYSYVTVRHESAVIDKLRKKFGRGELAAKLRERMDELL